jgi:hypothetical protein
MPNRIRILLLISDAAAVKVFFPPEFITAVQILVCFNPCARHDVLDVPTLFFAIQVLQFFLRAIDNP